MTITKTEVGIAFFELIKDHLESSLDMQWCEHRNDCGKCDGCFERQEIRESLHELNVKLREYRNA